MLSPLCCITYVCFYQWRLKDVVIKQMFSQGFLSVQYLVFMMFPACQMNGNTGWVFLFFFFFFHLINSELSAYHYSSVSLTVALMSTHPLSHIIFLNSSLA